MLSKKAIVQVLFLLAAVMMIGYGAWRGEAGKIGRASCRERV